jgi:CBS domain-containing protein
MGEETSQKRRTFTDQDAQDITRADELAYELRIAEVMSKEVQALNPQMQVEAALDLFRKHRISGAPVVENERLLGVVSIEDLIRALRAGDNDKQVSTYMTSPVITVRSTDPVVEALKIFVKGNIGRLPVVEGEKLVGIITKGDITRGLLEALQRNIHQEEIIRYRASHLFEDIISDRTSLILRYKIKPRDFTHGGTASSHIKRALLTSADCPPLRYCHLRSRNQPDHPYHQRRYHPHRDRTSPDLDGSL